jgi:hypothetical protein
MADVRPHVTFAKFARNPNSKRSLTPMERIVLDIGTLIADDVEYAADRRSMNAVEFPDDAVRNSEAAARLYRIAADLKALEGSHWHWRVQALCSAHGEHYSGTLSELIRAVGFRSSSKTGLEFLEELVFLLDTD